MEVAMHSRTATPVKDSHGSQSKFQEIPKSSENSNPNLPRSSPASKPSSSPLNKSAKSQKSAPRHQTANGPNAAVFSPRNKIRERKFVVAKKISKKEKANSMPVVDCKCREKFGGNTKKCICAAYEKLRASQEEFFKSKDPMGEKFESEYGDYCNKAENEGILTESPEIVEAGSSGENRSSIIIKRRRERMLEEARNSVPECGKVLHLVKAFEKLLTVPGSKESDKIHEKEPEGNDAYKKPVKWALPGLQQPKVPDPETETHVSCSSFCPSDFVLTAENLGLDSQFGPSSSWDSSRGSISSRSSNGGRRSRRNSSDSFGTTGGSRWKKKQLQITSQKPFKLRTEQRGRAKEEEFMKKMQEIMMEEERQRIPIAQGLPWTTDEPEVLIKPPVKENTRPIDLRLHSDLRAVERAEFDHQVSEKISLIEQYKMERERQQKLAEEEEIRRLRRELIPKAQPMPYFDRPFVPRRSMRDPTIPREPKFHIPQHKKMKCSLSWSSFALQHQAANP